MTATPPRPAPPPAGAPPAAGAPPWTAGLDIGGTKVLGVLLDASCAVRASVRAPTRPGRDGVVATAVDVLERLRAQVGAAPHDLAAVGVGVPGLVDPLDGSVSHAVNLGIDGTAVPLAGVLAGRLDGAPVLV